MIRHDFFSGLKIRTRIILAVGMMFLLALLIVGRSTLQVLQLTDRMDESFLTNRQLLDVENSLQLIGADIEDYLYTRSTVSLEQYYDHVQTYERQIVSFAREPSATETDILEKNIVRMSERYFALADRAITEKRGRDIDAYQATYSELLEQYRYLQAMISVLNDRQFEKNAVSNDAVLSSARDVSRSAVIVLVLLALVGIFLIYMLRRMVDPIESEIRERQIRMEAQVKDAELKYLRAQINPHFLFNTLNAGTQLAMMEDADRTYQYLHKVADFYRFVVHREGVDTSLQQELEIVDDFMYIINVRYGGEIRFITDIDDDLKDTRGPSMILQPIVENCIKHGLAEKEGEKTVTIRAHRTSDGLAQIDIEDDGKGMDAETVAQILSVKEPEEGNQDSQEKTGVGLKNVLRRLRMYYNKEDVMEILSGETGTCVRLLLPVSKEGD